MFRAAAVARLAFDAAVLRAVACDRFVCDATVLRAANRRDLDGAVLRPATSNRLALVAACVADRLALDGAVLRAIVGGEEVAREPLGGSVTDVAEEAEESPRRTPPPALRFANCLRKPTPGLRRAGRGDCLRKPPRHCETRRESRRPWFPARPAWRVPASWATQPDACSRGRDVAAALRWPFGNVHRGAGALSTLGSGASGGGASSIARAYAAANAAVFEWDGSHRRKDLEARVHSVEQRPRAIVMATIVRIVCLSERL